MVTYLRRCHYLDSFAVLDTSNIVQKVEVQCVCVRGVSGDRYKESCSFWQRRQAPSPQSQQQTPVSHRLHTVSRWVIGVTPSGDGSGLGRAFCLGMLCYMLQVRQALR